MEKEMEKMCVYFLAKLRSEFDNISKPILFNFANITDNDWNDIASITKEMFLDRKTQNKKLLKEEIDKVGNFVHGSEGQDVFEFFTLNYNGMLNKCKEQLERFKKEDILITLNNFDSSTYNKIKNDALINQFYANDAFMKLIDIATYRHYIKDVLITFNRELIEYKKEICDSIGETYGPKNLIDDILKCFSENEEVKNLISRLEELRARRNIVEHNQSVINDKYIKTAQKYADKKGALLITSPCYVTDRYKDIISFYVIATKICLHLKGQEMDEEFLISEVKKATHLKNEFEYLISLQLD